MRNRLAIGLLVAAAFAFGGLVGFFVGVGSTKAGSEFMKDMLTSEKPADTGRTLQIARKAFRLSYPANWKVDTEDDDYNPDHLFSIDSPGDSIVMFTILDMDSNPAEDVKNHVDGFVPKLITNPEKTEFKRWGRYEGVGVKLKGRMMRLVPGSVRIFSHSGKDRSFTVVEQTYDDDATSVRPGFKLVEESFMLIEPATPPR